MRIGALVALALLAAATAAAQECDELVFVEPGPGSVSVSHIEALYNCCAWIEFEIVQESFTIEIHEWERFEDGPCYCLCCFDLFATVGGLAPGEYDVSVWKHRFDAPAELLGVWPVTVDGSSAPLVDTTYIPCAGTDVEASGTWGVIKALYR